MTTVNSEWLSTNSVTAFPFQETAVIPADFLVDMRLFLSGTAEGDAYLSNVTYNNIADSYTLTFSLVATGAAILTGTLTRLNNGTSRVRSKQMLAQGVIVCLFTPGAEWDNLTWLGNGSWSRDLKKDESLIESSLVVPGPNPFLGIYIEGQEPPAGTVPVNATFKLMGGFNIAFTESNPKVPLFSGAKKEDPTENTFLTAGWGLGMGTGIDSSPTKLGYLATFDGNGPDGAGNITIDTKDCFRSSIPVVDGVPMPLLLLTSDCLPCCDCSQYRNVATAVNRLSQKMRIITRRLQTTLASSYQNYEVTRQYINAQVSAYNAEIDSREANRHHN